MKLDAFINIDTAGEAQGYLHMLKIWALLGWVPEQIVRVRSAPAAEYVAPEDFTLDTRAILKIFKEATDQYDLSESLVVMFVRPSQLLSPGKPAITLAHDESIVDIIREIAMDNGISEEDVRITYVVQGVQPMSLTFSEFDEQRGA